MVSVEQNWQNVIEACWTTPIRNLPPPADYALLSLPLDDGRYDAVVLAELKTDRLHLTDKKTIIQKLGNELFDSEKDWDEDRIGNFLKTAVEMYEDEYTPEQLRQTFETILTPSVLEILAYKSARQRWNWQNAEAALHAYTRFLTIDKLYGKEQGEQIKKQLACDLVFAREFDIACDQATLSKAGTINLGAQGVEAAQLGVKYGLRFTSREIGIKPHLYPYYRDRILVMGESKDGFMTPDEIVAELLRVEGAPRGAGVELSVFGSTFDTDGELIIYPGVANVSGNLLAAVGAADTIRLKAIQKEGIEFDKPQRTDALRGVQLQNPVDVMVATYGDGAWQNLGMSLEMAATSRAPVIFLCENNEVAIGTEQSETTANPFIWQKGHAATVPGVRVDSANFDATFMAARFATIRAAYDGGPTNLEVMTDREVSHSSYHGNHLVARIIADAREILSEQLVDLDGDERIPLIREFMNRTIFAPDRFDTTLRVRERIRQFMEQVQLDDQLQRKLQDIVDGIRDPSEIILEDLIDEDILARDELIQMQQEFKAQAQGITEEVSGRKLPSVDMVGKYIRYPHPVIVTQESVQGETEDGRLYLQVEDSDDMLTMTGAEVEREVLLQVMKENQGLVVGGIDAYAGMEVKDNAIHHKGGYFHQMNGIWEEMACFPGRFWNLPIAEKADTERWLGAATQPADMVAADFAQQVEVLQGNLSPDEIDLDKNLKRFFMDFEYGDYGIEALPAWLIHGGIYQTTSGKMIRPMGVILPCSMVAGGGAMHSHSVEAIANQTPEGVSLYTVSNAQTLYEVLNYTLRFENNPYVIVFDRSAYSRKESWRKGSGFFEPGTDRIIQKGKDLQVVTWGPMTKVVQEVVTKVQQQFPDASIGILDKVSWRPRKEGDLAQFLSAGTGPVFIATEDFRSRSLGNQVITDMMTSEEVAPHFVDRGRKIHYMASTDVSHPYCDGILMNALKPGVDTLSAAFAKALQEELEK